MSQTATAEKSTSDGPYADAIRNPGHPEHLMVIKPVEHRVQIFDGDTLVAETENAVRVMEVGRTVYDPVIYVPKGDLRETLEFGERTTHCPLKGDATYGSLGGREIGWTYETLDFADALDGYIGFWPKWVRIVEGQ